MTLATLVVPLTPGNTQALERLYQLDLSATRRQLRLLGLLSDFTLAVVL